MLEKCNMFEEAKKQYCFAKTILLANFVDILPLQYDFAFKEHQYDFETHRKFIEKQKLQPHPQLLIGSQKLQKDLNKGISGTNLKTKYLDMNELNQIIKQKA